MKFKLLFITIILMSLVILGCGAATQKKAAAEAVATQLFEAIKIGDFDAALVLYGPEFFGQISADDWKESLEKMKVKLGDLQKYDLVRWNIKTKLAGANKGTQCILNFNVTYSNYPAQETLTLYAPDGVTFTILGHNINSVGFLKE